MLTFLAYLQNFLPQRLLRDDRGVTSVEYALLLFLVVAVVATGAALLGTAVSGEFSKIAGDF
jgi:Flp pilus assembly pilin Flp